MRFSSASNERCPVRSVVASASSRIARARSTSPARASARPAQFQQPVEGQDVLFAQKFDAATHGLEPAPPVAALSVAKPSRQTPTLAKTADHARARDGRARGRPARRAEVPPHQLEHRRVRFPTRASRNARGSRYAPRARQRANRATDVAQRPQREREINHRHDASVVSEAEREIVVPAGMEQGDRTLHMLSRATILRRTNGWTPHAMRDASLGRIGLASRSLRKVAACPSSPTARRERSYRPTGRSRRQPSGASLSRPPTHGLWRKLPSSPARPASRRNQGVAIGHVQMKPLADDARRCPPPALSAIAIALPRCAIASWKAERRSA